MYLTEDTNALRSRAHEIWVYEGQPEGRALDHWLTAQREWARSLEAVQPWYGDRADEAATDWMRRMLWQPQPFDAKRAFDA